MASRFSLIVAGGLFVCFCALLAIPALAKYMPNGHGLAESLNRHSKRVDLAKRLDALALKRGAPAFIRIFKAESELELWLKNDTKYQLVGIYPICAWSGYEGPKLKEGDRQSPEGFYRVSLGSLNPNSSYHLSFNLGFPNAYDQAHGRTGSFLMVHGDCLSVGCYAMTDPVIEEIYDLVEAALRTGQNHVPVHIFPFRMNESRLIVRRNEPWAQFWQNLKTGYDIFEQTGVPPIVGVCDKSYVFGEQAAEGCS